LNNQLKFFKVYFVHIDFNELFIKYALWILITYFFWKYDRCLFR
jgi:hypothetical protein